MIRPPDRVNRRGHAESSLMKMPKRLFPGPRSRHSRGVVPAGRSSMRFAPGALRLLVPCLVTGGDLHAQAPAKQEAKLADYFGFQPLELYKLEHRIGNLVLKDLDGDKIDDIIVSNNARSRIDLLLSTKKPVDEQARRPFRKDVNDIESERRLRLVSIQVNKEIVSLDVGEFNGDGKPDLVFYGTPAEVEIFLNEGDGRFSAPKRISTGEAAERSSALTVGDLDQDGRDDIALLA